MRHSAGEEQWISRKAGVVSGEAVSVCWMGGRSLTDGSIKVRRNRLPHVRRLLRLPGPLSSEFVEVEGFLYG